MNKLESFIATRFTKKGQTETKKKLAASDDSDLPMPPKIGDKKIKSVKL